MATIQLDLRGLKCPEPAMKVAAELFKLKKGDLLEAQADCETFEVDMRQVCTRWKKTLLSVKQAGTAKIVQIQI